MCMMLECQMQLIINKLFMASTSFLLSNLQRLFVFFIIKPGVTYIVTKNNIVY